MASQIARTHTGSFFKEPRTYGSRFSNRMPVGKRTLKRAEQNRELNKLPDSVKRRCEIGLPGCLRTLYLSWAHSHKSRFLITDRDWQAAARACGFCHQTIESMSHKDMERIVNQAISRRTKNGRTEPPLTA